VTDEPVPLRLCDSLKCTGVGPDGLSVSTTRGNLCASCWKRLGRPAPAPSTMHEESDAALAARDRMLARGGTDRHMVRSGKAGV
jgi:hypothetical protein